MHGQSVEHCWVAVLQHWSARQSAFDLQHATQLVPWQHWPAPQSVSVQHTLAGRHEPLQQCSAVPHWASLVQAQVPHCSVIGLQHWSARQSEPDRHPVAHSFFLQIGAPPSTAQSPLPQQFPWTQADPQHFAPAPHCASPVQGQLVEHSFVVVSQHWSARQSADERQPTTQPLSLQIGVLPPQSPFAQHAPATQEPLQHFCPVPHWASSVHVQLSVPHWRVTVLQHWSAMQSPFEWQHAMHEPEELQHSDEEQSESAQHAALVQEPPQHL